MRTSEIDSSLDVFMVCVKAFLVLRHLIAYCRAHLSAVCLIQVHPWRLNRPSLNGSAPRLNSVTGYLRLTK